MAHLVTGPTDLGRVLRKEDEQVERRRVGRHERADGRVGSHERRSEAEAGPRRGGRRSGVGTGPRRSRAEAKAGAGRTRDRGDRRIKSVRGPAMAGGQRRIGARRWKAAVARRGLRMRGADALSAVGYGSSGSKRKLAERR